jgi:hypothetical protein
LPDVYESIVVDAKFENDIVWQNPKSDLDMYVGAILAFEYLPHDFAIGIDHHDRIHGFERLRKAGTCAQYQRDQKQQGRSSIHALRAFIGSLIARFGRDRKASA